MAEAFRQPDQNESSTRFRCSVCTFQSTWSFSKQRVQIFELIDELREGTLKGYGNDILLEASCFLVSSSISEEALALRPDIGVKPVPRWRFILDISLRHRNDTVQAAAARTIGVLSHLRSSEDDTNR